MSILSSTASVASICSSSVSYNHSRNNYVHGHHHRSSFASFPLMRPMNIPKSSNLGLLLTKRAINMELNAIESLQNGEQILSSSSNLFPLSVGWSNWILWTLIPIILSFTKSKWGPLLTFKKELDKAMDTVEFVAEAVEEVAIKVDKMAEEVGHNLPDGSKLKDAIHRIENVAEQAIKCADLAEDLIHKAEEIEEKMEKFLDRPEVVAAEDQEKLVS